ncbi:hypothetical protein I542_1190 [Mycobacteroides abscessus 1948]|uniref:Uncharacterized protein n=1 Tax=Mycobacteroides abscessus 1948 TaxID=1299323 RepID=A0A829QCX6_9MYCO|nr:hypothetical protein I542_1190 [Mycobacteroides abscessus 1948]
MKTQRHDVGLEDTLRAIERGVLEDVWMSRPRRWSVLLASLLLGVAAVSRWSNLGAHASPSLHVDAVVPGTSIMFLAACMFSLIALRRRRFRWCCGARLHRGAEHGDQPGRAVVASDRCRFRSVGVDAACCICLCHVDGYLARDHPHPARGFAARHACRPLLTVTLRC